MVDIMCSTNVETEFWIEEKLDGERMQMHMVEDETVNGGFRFRWWSRKGKDYTYLYGEGFEDDTSALTRHLKGAFESRIKSLILDGEMITWDPVRDKMVAFGSLKTAALSEQRNPFQGAGERPLFRVFDCLFINDEDIARYTLKDRHNVLDKSVSDIHRRIEKHPHEIGREASDIEPALRKVVSESSEGLVLKKPLSSYALNERNDSWIKVKPEYMTEFGESLDCVIIGGYYGGGRRGDIVASYLCGLRVDKDDVAAGDRPEKCLSFFKVGGGFRAEDYAMIHQEIGDKWLKWDRNKPPNDYIKLGGGDRQHERPDLWIPAHQSVVLEVKAASVGSSDRYGYEYTLRFPRFKKLRKDKAWDEALSVSEFVQQKLSYEKDNKEKEFKIDTKRKITKKLKKEIVIAGNEETNKALYTGPRTKIFEGLTFCVLSEMVQPERKSKAELEQILKSNGAAITQSAVKQEDVVVISDKRVVKVAAIQKADEKNIIRPNWILDVLKQAEADGPNREKHLLPYEPKHIFHSTQEMKQHGQKSPTLDKYGDSFARDATALELTHLLAVMTYDRHESNTDHSRLLERLELYENHMDDIAGTIFQGCAVAFWGQAKPTQYTQMLVLKYQLSFAGGRVVQSNDVESTHVVILEDDDLPSAAAMVQSQGRHKLPRMVSLDWLAESWQEQTRLDEERYAIA